MPTGGEAPLRIEPCVAVSVHDGDTFRADVPLHYLWTDLALGSVHLDVRVAHVNAAELATPAGKAAAQAVEAWLLHDATHSPLRLLIYGRDKYGRVLADAQTPDGSLLSAFVLSLTGTVPERLGVQLHPA